MPSFLMDQLEHVGRRARETSQRAEHEWVTLADEVTEMTALAVHLLDRIDALAARKMPEAAPWDEAVARSFIPLYAAWFEFATVVRDLRRACKDRGYPIEGAEPFLHRYNRARMVAVEFDSIVQSFRRFERDEMRGRPLDEGADGLRDRP